MKICLQWVYEQGVGCIVKSYNKNRMKENLDIFDWRLNSVDLKKISEIPQETLRPSAYDFIHDKGPYKSLEELWDGEI
ncbi:hypothetical protein L484_003278 [Morus notabilis]|uniref:NADP-dependent oxidoreductase domain-containing protein n=1 Tax=Morus notabilis TaxID=981085 RepID=W9SI19_9ROSA|nr:hypothetical protein L484_003278 [Morus notabilis]